MLSLPSQAAATTTGRPCGSSQNMWPGRSITVCHMLLLIPSSVLSPVNQGLVALSNEMSNVVLSWPSPLRDDIRNTRPLPPAPKGSCKQQDCIWNQRQLPKCLDSSIRHKTSSPSALITIRGCQPTGPSPLFLHCSDCLDPPSFRTAFYRPPKLPFAASRICCLASPHTPPSI